MGFLKTPEELLKLKRESFDFYDADDRFVRRGKTAKGHSQCCSRSCFDKISSADTNGSHFFIPPCFLTNTNSPTLYLYWRATMRTLQLGEQANRVFNRRSIYNEYGRMNFLIHLKVSNCTSNVNLRSIPSKIVDAKNT